MPDLDLSRHRRTHVGKLIYKALRLKAVDNYTRLDLLYGADTQRIARQVACGTSLVEVALDQGRAFTAGHSQLICELEIELKQGTRLAAVALACQWFASHGLWTSTIANSVKSKRLRSSTTVGGATTDISHKFLPRFSQHAPVVKLITAEVHSCISQMLSNISELAPGNNHPDQIH